VEREHPVHVNHFSRLLDESDIFPPEQADYEIPERCERVRAFSCFSVKVMKDLRYGSRRDPQLQGARRTVIRQLQTVIP
jgi:hypothetical protein